MPPRPAASPDDIEMSNVFGALRREAPKLAILGALAAAATFGLLLLVAPKFQSQAEMAIVAKGAANTLADPKTNAAPESLSVKMDKEAVNTHVRALQSPELIAKIATELKLAEKKEFNSAKGPVDILDQVSRLVGLGGPRPEESERDRVLNALFKNLEVYAPKETRSINVRVTSVEPRLAADIANAIAETYRKSLAAAATQEVDEQQSVLTTKIDKLTPEVAAAETEVERFRGEINVFKGGAQNTGLNEQQLSELTAELTRAKASRSEVEARSRSARDMLKAGTADALPDAQKSPLIQNLVQQRVRIERQISELSATLLPGHPRMQQLNADLGGLKKQIGSEISKLVESLDREAKVAQGREEAIKKSLDEIKAKVVNKAPEEAKLRSLEANVKAKRTELENLQAQLEANRKRLDARAQPVEAQIISKAQPASLPVSPKKEQSAALIGFAMLLLGVFWTITRALFSGARSEGRAAEHSTSPAAGNAAPANAVEEETEAADVPVPPLTRVSAQAKPLDSSNAPKVSDIAARLRQAASVQGGHRALITGDTAAIPAGREAIAVARALSETGAHIMLLEWSPSGMSVPGLKGVDSGQGISDLLAGEAGFDHIVRRIPATRVHYISCGMQTSGELDADQINLVLDALDEAYAHIVVVAAHDDARDLFEVIQGRFDAGILVTGESRAPATAPDVDARFLGFEVTGIEIMRLEASAALAVSAPGGRVARAVRKPTEERRSA